MISAPEGSGVKPHPAGEASGHPEIALLWVPGMELKDVKAQVARVAFHHYGQSQERTAEALGVSTRWLRTWLRVLLRPRRGS